MKSVKTERDLADLRCQNIVDNQLCNNTLGTTMTYTNHGENRLAFRIVQGNITKTKYKDQEELSKAKENKRDKKRKKYLK